MKDPNLDDMFLQGHENIENDSELLSLITK